MYATVPSSTPAFVSERREPSSVVNANCSTGTLASPKSMSWTRSSGPSSTMTLSGFTSLCTIPKSCAAFSAVASCRAMFAARSGGIGPWSMSLRSVMPRMNSITMNHAPSSSWLIS
ncbi:hypothetical protein BE08_35660 [Sorangium cellulosum]|uniref:Uncharacterized protein n=1 Tax=Sorangium cellulosum TaxID=56 RepID=A0A150PLS6_SORCE|nr:hypothetical protein BE08_35660 [Sorangium cellulosum]